MTRIIRETVEEWPHVRGGREGEKGCCKSGKGFVGYGVGEVVLGEGVAKGERDELVEGFVLICSLISAAFNLPFLNQRTASRGGHEGGRKVEEQGQRHVPIAFNLHVYCTCNCLHNSAKLCNCSGTISCPTPLPISACNTFASGWVSSMVNKSIQRTGDMVFLPAPWSRCLRLILLPNSTEAPDGVRECVS